jgi:hypothetical protein
MCFSLNFFTESLFEANHFFVFNNDICKTKCRINAQVGRKVTKMQLPINNFALRRVSVSLSFYGSAMTV